MNDIQITSGFIQPKNRRDFLVMSKSAGRLFRWMILDVIDAKELVRQRDLVKESRGCYSDKTSKTIHGVLELSESIPKSESIRPAVYENLL